jgi:hypothetical protein
MSLWSRTAVLAATALTVSAAVVQASARPADDPQPERATSFTVTAKFRDADVLRNERVVLSGTVKPVRTSKEVLVQRKDDDGWTTVARRPLKDNGRYRYAFKAKEPGEHVYRARMPRVGAVRKGVSPKRVLSVAEEKLVVFTIKAGTGAGDWNTEDTKVVADVGDTLRVVNKDSMTHGPQTEGDPFPDPTSNIPPLSKADYVLESAFDGTLHCAVHGPSSQFWITVSP